MGQKKLAVLASGRGSNFQAILAKITDGWIPACMGLCITNNPAAGVIGIAEEHRIDVRIINPRSFPDAEEFNNAILKELLEFGIDGIILAGYLKLIGRQIVERYENRIINIHPALLPAFGGKGMYGQHVHEAVYESGARISGATVHLVNSEYDSGPIVYQKCVDITNVKSAGEIAERVLKIEHEIFPAAVKLMVEDRIKVKGKRVEIVGG
jgi:formyltetrahydrofolate-dependent phosphoribosylglycinamide formyltransferase